MRLTGILDNKEPMRLGNLHNGVHISGLTEQVDRNDGFRPGRNRSLKHSGIDIVGLLVDIDKDWLGPTATDSLRGGNEGVRDSNHFVTVTLSRTPKVPSRGPLCRYSHQQRTGTGRTGHTPFPNFSTYGPPAKAELSSTFCIATQISSRIEVFWALRSINGILFMRFLRFLDPSKAPCEISSYDRIWSNIFCDDTTSVHDCILPHSNSTQ